MSNDSSIEVCKFGKGNGGAILKSEDYYSKLDKIVNDNIKFVEIRQDTDIINYSKRKFC